MSTPHSRPSSRPYTVDEDFETYGIDEPIPNEESIQSAGLSYSRALNTPEYPYASRFVPARHFRAMPHGRNISHIVIHITDGGSNINGPISWFRNPMRNGQPVPVSSHYVIGQDGETVQMVNHQDIAYHARGANGNSIGIEHCANPRNLYPSEAQYCASAALVNWLCHQYSIPMDRAHILGHSEADPSTTHSGCPNSVWDWDYYMGLVLGGGCTSAPTTQSHQARHSRSLSRTYSQGRYAHEFGAMPVDAAAVDQMRTTFVNNAAAADRQNCITITNAGLRQFYGSRLMDSSGQRLRLGSTIQDTMAALQGYGLAGAASIFEFNDSSGRMTRGVIRPDHLAASVENWIMTTANENQMSGWYIFGLSLMDGYHSVILALQFSGIGYPDTHLYWCDQIYSGWDDITGRLDARITELIQRWWDPLPANRKARTRVTVWSLQM